MVQQKARGNRSAGAEPVQNPGRGVPRTIHFITYEKDKVQETQKDSNQSGWVNSGSWRMVLTDGNLCAARATRAKEVTVTACTARTVAERLQKMSSRFGTKRLKPMG